MCCCVDLRQILSRKGNWNAILWQRSDLLAQVRIEALAFSASGGRLVSIGGEGAPPPQVREVSTESSANLEATLATFGADSG